MSTICRSLAVWSISKPREFTRVIFLHGIQCRRFAWDCSAAVDTSGRVDLTYDPDSGVFTRSILQHAQRCPHHFPPDKHTASQGKQRLNINGTLCGWNFSVTIRPELHSYGASNTTPTHATLDVCGLPLALSSPQGPYICSVSSLHI
jgi:hypothetical protein